MDKVEARILTELMAGLVVIHDLPTDLKKAEFIIKLFEDLPGIKRKSICFYSLNKALGNLPNQGCQDCLEWKNGIKQNVIPSCNLAKENNIHCFPFFTVTKTFGYLNVEVDSYEEVKTYIQHIHNFVNLVAIIIENHWQKNELKIQSEKDLKKSEDRFRTIFNEAQVGIALQDLKTNNFIQTNPAFCNMLGYSENELMLMSQLDITFPEDNQMEQTLYQKLLEQKQKSYQIEKRLLSKDSKIIWASTMVTCLYDIDNIPAHVLNIFVNVTDQKEAENEITKLNEELEKRVKERTAQLETINKELESFSYSVSHDLRSPLRAISGFSQILFEDYRNKLDKKGLDYLERILFATQNMDKLIEDILLLSYLTCGDISYQAVNLSQIAERIINEYKNKEPNRKVDIHIQPNMIVLGDPRLLKVAIENLMSNAWKFSSKNEITKIQFGTSIQEGNQVFYIQDNGVGFDMNQINKLFSVFQRLHSNKEFEGTGIGLTIVQRVIHRHQGRIWAEASLGEGATFKFTIPQRGR